VSRDLDLHCATCTCAGAGSAFGDPAAPYFALVVEVERAWSELMAADRAAGRSTRHPRSNAA
jgi:hypothetical protein